MTIVAPRYLLGALTSVFIVLAATAADGAGETDKNHLRFVGFTRYRDAFYVDTLKTKLTQHAVMSVWTWVKPAPKSILRSRLKREFRMAGHTVAALSHIEQLKEVDCRSDRIRHLKTSYYDEKGRLLFEKHYRHAAWQLIRPGSLWEALRRVVCHPL